jgi:ABC-2 type transport system permease protein
VIEAAIARRSFRQLRTSSLVCAVAFGATAASSAVTYVGSFPDAASRAQLAAATRGDAGLSVLLGPVGAIDTVGGYTAYKTYVFLTTIGAIWALFAATRLLRGEEDEGRWHLVLAGATRPARATGAVLVGIGLAIGVVVAGTSLLTWFAGRDPEVGFGAGSALLFGLSIGIVLVVSAAIGAITAQLARTRRSANALGAAVLAVAFVLRMIADSGKGAAWVRWTTPFGWSELVEPLTADHVGPLVPAVVATVALVGVAVALASRRDVGAGAIGTRDVAEPRLSGLGSMAGLALRRDVSALVAWAVGLAVTGLVLGIVSKLTAQPAPGSMGETLAKFGVRGSFVDQYFGVVFLLVASVVALLPAGQIGAAADEELSGRLVHLVVRPGRRRSWLFGRLGLAAVGVAAAGLFAGVGAWAGARTQGVDVGFASMVAAGLNVVPIALVALGFGAVVFAVVPRFAAIAVYAIVGGSLLIDLVASMVTSVRWLDHLSLFHYLALAPSVPIDAAELAGATAVAVGLIAIATVLFDRRDLRTG